MGGVIKERKPAREPQMEPQEDLPENEVEDIVVPIVTWPTEENPLANIINTRTQRLWTNNGSGQVTNSAIQELMATLGSYKRIKND
jgi:hypothetical protein